MNTGLGLLFWKMRPYYRLVADGMFDRVVWAPKGVPGGRMIRYVEFKRLVERHESISRLRTASEKAPGSGNGLDTAVWPVLLARGGQYTRNRSRKA